MGGELAADERGDERAAARLEEGLAEAFFHRREGARDGGLRQAEDGRAFGDAARLDDGGKLGKVAFFELHNSLVCCARKK